MIEIKLVKPFNSTPKGVTGIRITKDFAWFTLNGLGAKKLYNNTSVIIYQLYDNNTESMILDDKYHSTDWEDESLVFGIEIGSIEPINEEKSLNNDI